MPQQSLFAGRQQAIAPFERRTQRLLPRRSVAAVAGQQLQTLTKPGFDSGQAKQRYARRGKADRQGQAVQAAAQARNLGDVVLGELEAVVDSPHAVDEQGHGGRLQGLGERRIDLRQGQRSQSQRVFALKTQHGLAGHEQVDAGRRVDDPAQQRRERVDEMFCVVEHHQRLHRAQCRQHRRDRVVARCDRQGQRLADRAGTSDGAPRRVRSIQAVLSSPSAARA